MHAGLRGFPVRRFGYYPRAEIPRGGSNGTDMDTLPAYLPQADFVRPAETRPSADLPRTIVRRIVGEGGILMEPGQPPALVGELSWEDAGTVLWFAAFGDQPRDAHRLTFDQAECSGDRVVFRTYGRIVAELADVDHSCVDDPDDYRTAWQLWQQILPMRTPFILRCYERLLLDGYSVGLSDVQ